MFFVCMFTSWLLVVSAQKSGCFVDDSLVSNKIGISLLCSSAGLLHHTQTVTLNWYSATVLQPAANYGRDHTTQHQNAGVHPGDRHGAPHVGPAVYDVPGPSQGYCCQKLK